MLHQFYPEDNQAGIRISAAHIVNKFDLGLGMLVGMMMRPCGAVTQGVPGAIIAPHPAVDVLSVGFVFDSGLGDTIFPGIFYK